MCRPFLSDGAMKGTLPGPRLDLMEAVHQRLDEFATVAWTEPGGVVLGEEPLPRVEIDSFQLPR